tara:strand:- start:2146 stop:2535 length:390 start_codon:yes stop_codon:yes gene_type:complete
MATQTVHLPRQDYSSLQIGDRVYRTSTQQVGGFNTNLGSLLTVGEITNIQDGTIAADGVITNTTVLTIDVSDTLEQTTTDHYLLFQKSNIANKSSILGYYGEAEFENAAVPFGKIELFSVACEYSESSK